MPRADVRVFSEAQWVVITIVNSGSQGIKLKNLKLSYGKLYPDGDKNGEVPVDAYNDKIVPPGEKLHFNACGREEALAGSTGSFDVVDVTAGDRVIRHFYWDCPYWSSSNTWTISEDNAKWLVQSSGANLGSGALGNITIEFLNKPGRKAYCKQYLKQ